MTEGFIPPHGGYHKLFSYQRAVRFCERYFERRDRTIDQMVQAARSGKQNIIEASVASGTSKETEIKLTNVARASLEELLGDYRDFLRLRGLEEWDKNHRNARRLAELVRTPGAAFIPLLTLAIPSNAVMALLLGALLIFGMQPGPMLIKEHPDLFWGAVTSMYLGNGMLLILNLPLIGLWVQVLKVPYRFLFPLILLFCVIGAFGLNNNTAEVTLMVIFGVVGYLLKKFKYPLAPAVLALVLGPMLEKALRQSLLMSGGSGLIFVTRPISLVMIIIGFLLLTSSMVPWVTKRRGDIQEAS